MDMSTGTILTHPSDGGVTHLHELYRPGMPFKKCKQFLRE